MTGTMIEAWAQYEPDDYTPSFIIYFVDGSWIITEGWDEWTLPRTWMMITHE